MRTADSRNVGALHVVAVGGGEETLARVLVGWIGGRVAEEGRGEEGGDVGVVHYVEGAVAIYFVGVEGSGGGVDDGELVDGTADRAGQGLH